MNIRGVLKGVRTFSDGSSDMLSSFVAEEFVRREFRLICCLSSCLESLRLL
jgi:hypothetical protein